MTTRTFNDTAARDAYLRETYPTRTCSDTPGLYDVPGGQVGVYLNEVTFYAAEPAGSPGSTWTYPCGCVANWERLSYCALHAQAEALREALKTATAALAVISTGSDNATALKTFAAQEFRVARDVLRAVNA